MIALKKEPDKDIMLTTVDNELKALQEAVGGYVEAVTIASDVVILCDEEGRIKGKPYCCSFANIDFCGTILAVGVKDEEFCDLSAQAGVEVRKMIKVKR